MNRFSKVLIISVIAAALIMPVAADAAWWQPFARIFRIKENPSPNPSPTIPANASPLPLPTPGRKSKVSPTPTPSAVLVECIQDAVRARDKAIINAWDALHDSGEKALETRMSQLISAWKIADKKERKEALKKVWTEYRLVIKTARNVFRDTKRAAWQKFEKDRKNCGVPSDDLTGSGIDSDL